MGTSPLTKPPQLKAQKMCQFQGSMGPTTSFSHNFWKSN